MSKAWRDKYYFGGNREIAIQRDGEKCVHCGMTRQEHKAKYGCDITVDHIDGNGCLVPKEKKNNALDNLQTLCYSCHRRKDLRNEGEKHGLSKLKEYQVRYIRTQKGTRTGLRLAKKLGVHSNTIYGIWNGKRWRHLPKTENSPDALASIKKELGL
jgi:hypothetical protein